MLRRVIGGLPGRAQVAALTLLGFLVLMVVKGHVLFYTVCSLISLGLLLWSLKRDRPKD
jgi:hypothetical protein